MAMDDDEAELQVDLDDDVTSEFASYEDYLDRQITPVDMYYLEDKELARQLIEHGYRGNAEILTREEFEARKRAAESARLAKMYTAPEELASANKSFDGRPLLAALAQREEALRSGKLTTIVYVRHTNGAGQEVSGYIDFADRLKTENLEAVFAGKRLLIPKAGDLSYYNWDTQTSTSTPTPNFQVIADNEAGLLFKNKRDRKVINVDPEAHPGDNSARIEISDPKYLQVVLFDHVTRRRP